MIYVAESLGEQAEQLGPDLTNRCEQILADRIRFCLRTCPEAYGRVGFRNYHHGWQDRAAELYAIAAEASARRSAKDKGQGEGQRTKGKGQSEKRTWGEYLTRQSDTRTNTPPTILPSVRHGHHSALNDSASLPSPFPDDTEWRCRMMAGRMVENRCDTSRARRG